MDGASGLPMTMGVLFFAFQLYFDFSAYSQMAIGVARTLGFELTTNFRRPYLSSSFSEFWKRWHISLSSWFKDYVYIPLGGNRSHTRKTIFNVFIVFVLSGLWHGASWNFVIWGFVNGLFLVLLDRYLIKNKIPMINCVLVGALWSLSLVFFRSQTFTQSIQVLNELGFSNSSNLYSFGLNKFEFNLSIGLLIFALLLELIEEKKGDILSVISTKSVLIRYFFYVSLIASILAFGVYGDNLNDSKFIYFQF
jgi:D-alanyl-lipoteichoic acid acyltransferase DltB (MBOAT superfamily)